jgi:hypothetical protein
MKRCLFFALILLTNLASGQNYRNICTQGVTFYKNSQSALKGFRLDSVLLPGGNDSVFLSYRSIIDTGGTCMDTTNGSILGLKIYKKNNGWFYFFNRYNDSIRINSQAALNDSWKFINLPNGGYLQAEVTGIITDSVLGTTDQVKIISFQAKDGNNNNIGHVLNQRSIKLSQHYGLTQMLHVYFIPDDTTAYVLAGKSHPAIGIQEITWKDIYNYDIGDVFHYAGYASGPGGSGVWERRQLVLNKIVYGINDSVLYLIERCVSEGGGPPPYSYTWIDTTNVMCNFDQLMDNALPEEFNNINCTNEYYRKIGFNHQRQTKGINLYIWCNQGPLHNCWLNPYPPLSIKEYTEGLGCTYNLYEYSREYLVYYQKGSETWGTPVTTDCGIQLGTGQKQKAGEITLQIIPNPVEYQAEIILDGFDYHDNLKYVLYDYSGHMVKEGNVESNIFSFDRWGFSNGIYLLIVRDNNGEIKGRKKIIFN